jgi:hypothetical protein
VPISTTASSLVVHPRQQQLQGARTANPAQTLHRSEAHETVLVVERDVKQLGRLLVASPGKLRDGSEAHPAIRVSQARSYRVTHRRKSPKDATTDWSGDGQADLCGDRLA